MEPAAAATVTACTTGPGPLRTGEDNFLVTVSESLWSPIRISLAAGEVLLLRSAEDAITDRADSVRARHCASMLKMKLPFSRSGV